jgi:hypothetical protein
MRRVVAVIVLATVSCGRPPADPTVVRHDGASSLEVLRGGDFAGAHAAATRALTRDDRDPIAAAVRALATYQRAATRFRAEVVTTLDAAEGRGLDLERMRAIFERFGSELDAVDLDLAVAGRDPSFALELCVACWRHDWNHSGGVDDRDRALLQIGRDATGRDLPPGDPRRTPTFRFDAGDVHWARAMVAFQRAVIELGLAYDWKDLARVMYGDLFDLVTSIRIRLVDARRVHRARDLIVFGLEQTDRARVAYLAETDDDREWLPNPRQHDRPVISMPVDDDLYATWQTVVGDVRALVQGRQGGSMAELARVWDATWSDPPTGFVDVAKLLDDPQDVVIDLPAIARGIDRDDSRGITRILGKILGGAYVAEMPASPLVDRLRRIKSEIDRGETTWSAKLRYVLYIN